MRLLLVEDHRLLAEALRRGLKSSYAVDIALTGQDGLLLAEHTPYDVILLDLGLPDTKGEDICAAMRRSGIKAPIIVVTGRDVVRDKVTLLDIGADDYITKPFNLEEVKARIRAAMRHHSSQPIDTKLQYADLILDPATRTVERQDRRVELRRKEFDLLEYMMRNRGRALTRPMIMEHIWDMNENLWANVVDVHIKHLRDKVDRPFGSKIIKTIHGVGYKLEV